MNNEESRNTLRAANTNGKVLLCNTDIDYYGDRICICVDPKDTLK